MRLAKVALEAGHRVNLFASADGVYAFTVGQRAKGFLMPRTVFVA